MYATVQRSSTVGWPMDVALDDENQQCGNLDEASAIARITRKGIVIWCGDHKQTPGELCKNFHFIFDLLCSNYWIQPIYQELLHSSSSRNPARECERKRPSSGLARVTAYAKPHKQRKPSASGTSFSDWIGGTCQADTLQVWFPAHWAPVVLQQLQKKKDKYRAEHLLGGGSS